MVNSKRPTTSAKYLSAPAFLLENTSARDVQVYLAMLALGDFRKLKYQHGAERLARYLRCSADTVERSIGHLQAIGAVAALRRPGFTTVYRMCDFRLNQPLPASTPDADPRNALRGTRERVENWDGARLATYFEDALPTSAWWQREMAGVQTFANRQAVITFLHKDCKADGLGQVLQKGWMDAFIEYAPKFVPKPGGNTRAWTLYQNAFLIGLFDLWKLLLDSGQYDDHVGAWATEIDDHWFEFQEPTDRHHWGSAQDDDDYAWYHASAVFPSRDATAKLLNGWTSGDLARQMAAHISSLYEPVTSDSIEALEQYLAKNRKATVPPSEILGTFDATLADLRRRNVTMNAKSLKHFMDGSHDYADPQEPHRWLGFVRYGMNPALVVGSPIQRRQPAR